MKCKVKSAPLIPEFEDALNSISEQGKHRVDNFFKTNNSGTKINPALQKNGEFFSRTKALRNEVKVIKI